MFIGCPFFSNTSFQLKRWFFVDIKGIGKCSIEFDIMFEIWCFAACGCFVCFDCCGFRLFLDAAPRSSHTKGDQSFRYMRCCMVLRGGKESLKAHILEEIFLFSWCEQFGKRWTFLGNAYSAYLFVFFLCASFRSASIGLCMYMGEYTRPIFNNIMT